MKIHEYNQMMKYLTRPAEPEYEQVAMAGSFIKGGKKLIGKLLKEGKVKKGEAPKTDVEKIKTQKESFDQTEKELAKSEQIPVKDQTVKSEYKFTGRETQDDLYELEEKGIISRADHNVYGERYLDYLDAKVKYYYGYTKGQMNKIKNQPARLNYLRAQVDPNWGEANFGEDYTRILEKARGEEIKAINPGQADKSGPFDHIFEKMYKPVRDDIEKAKDKLPGEDPLPTEKKRTLNADGGRIGFEDGGARFLKQGRNIEPLSTDVQDWLKKTFPNKNFNFKDYKYGVSKMEDPAFYKNIDYIVDQRIKKGKDYKYVPKGTDPLTLEYEEGYGTKDQFVKKAREKGITVNEARYFAKSYNVDTKKNPYQKSGTDKIYDMTVLDDPEFVEDVVKRQIATGTSKNKEMIKKYKKEVDEEKLEKRKRSKTRRKTLKQIGSSNFEGRMRDFKRKIGNVLEIPKEKIARYESIPLDQAHRSDFRQLKKLGESLQPGDLGVDPFRINREDVKGLEKKLEPLYKKQKQLYNKASKLDKVPKELINSIDKNNTAILKTFEDFPEVQGRVLPIQLDPKTLSVYKGGEDITKQLGAGLIDTPVKNIKVNSPEEITIKANYANQILNEAANEGLIDRAEGQKKLDKFFKTQPIDDLPTQDILKDVVSGKQLSANPLTDMVRVALPTLPAIFGPTGIAGLTYALRPEGGYDLSRPEDRLTFELEAALAPATVKGTSKAASYLAGGNQPLRRGLERAINLGMRAAPALRVARALSPLGLLSLAGEAGYYTYKKAQETQAAIDAMTPHQRELYESQMQGEALGTELGFANGGRVGFEKGGSSSDKKKTPFDKPTIQIDPNAPVDPAKRDTLKGAGILGAGVALGKLGLLKLGKTAKVAKAAKVAPLTKVVAPLGKTMTEFPEWFPTLISKVRKEGKQIPIYKQVEVPITEAEYNKLTKEKVKNVYDAHLGRTDWYKEKLKKEGVPRYTRLKQTDEIIGYKYEVKDLPDVDVVEYGGEELTVSFPNAYGRSVTMEYTPPKGTKDATFQVDDAVPESGGYPGDVPDFYAETVNSLDEVYGGASRIEQKVLKLKKPRTTQGDEVVARAEAQYDYIKDTAEDFDDF